ncbi:MAG: hypothetical protein H6574_01160 [Lewinellaceae bacterium]|nr:carbohydrate kinase [Saprospiraceae bacterium]MCB9329665.1 hypothetical protein [Lewinellaceae bacterium]
MDVTAIFDIGKTNKKFFLFDEQHREVHRAYTRLEEIQDEDGFPCEDLEQLCTWMKDSFREAQEKTGVQITRLNFSTYGASFVHLDANGQPVAPLYNYLKPFPEDLQDSFFKKYGPAEQWSAETASPVMGMLNSSLQLYWLKYRRPEIFERIHRSLHFPQFCAYLFTDEYRSEYTSIGCHTGMWHFENKDYHPWIYAEKIDRLLPPIQDAVSVTEVKIGNDTVQVGTGIHDSSAALLPYIAANTEPFLLISTGTWSITLNPFSQDSLEVGDLERDCLNYLRVDGLPVRAARLFLGNEYKIWATRLAQHFKQPYEKHRHVEPDPEILQQLKRLRQPVYHWDSLAKGLPNTASPGSVTNLDIFNSYEEAYHQLIRELVDMQVEAINLARGNTRVQKIYIDGGFIDNALFIQLLAGSLPAVELITTNSPLGSALGAALAVHNQVVSPDFLSENFSLQTQVALQL